MIRSRPAESAAGFAAVITAVLLWAGMEEELVASVVLVVGAVPGIVTGLVEWWRQRKRLGYHRPR